MSEKTAIEKAREALVEIANQEVGTWDKPVPFSVLYRRSVDIAREALAALDAEKPAGDAVLIADDYLSEHFPMDIETGTVSEKNVSAEGLAEIMQSFAESYHAAQCAKCFEKLRDTLPAFPHRKS